MDKTPRLCEAPLRVLCAWSVQGHSVEEKVFIVAGLPHYTYFLRATNQPVKRYSIAPSFEGVISYYFKSPHPPAEVL